MSRADSKQKMTEILKTVHELHFGSHALKKRKDLLESRMRAKASKFSFIGFTEWLYQPSLARLKPGAWTPPGCPLWVAGAQAPGTSPTAFSDALTRSWLRSRYSDRGCWHRRQQLDPLYHTLALTIALWWEVKVCEALASSVGCWADQLQLLQNGEKWWRKQWPAHFTDSKELMEELRGWTPQE